VLEKEQDLCVALWKMAFQTASPNAKQTNSERVCGGAGCNKLGPMREKKGKKRGKH